MIGVLELLVHEPKGVPCPPLYVRIAASVLQAVQLVDDDDGHQDHKPGAAGAGAVAGELYGVRPSSSFRVSLGSAAVEPR